MLVGNCIWKRWNKKKRFQFCLYAISCRKRDRLCNVTVKKLHSNIFPWTHNPAKHDAISIVTVLEIPSFSRMLLSKDFCGANVWCVVILYLRTLFYLNTKSVPILKCEFQILHNCENFHYLSIPKISSGFILYVPCLWMLIRNCPAIIIGVEDPWGRDSPYLKHVFKFAYFNMHIWKRTKIFGGKTFGQSQKMYG